MKTNKSSNTKTETRYTGDWKVFVKKSGDHITRKVVTKGVRKVYCFKTLFELEHDLREGYEVRLTFDNNVGNQVECVRLIPMMKPDCSGMYVSAQPMGELCSTLKDIKPKLIRRAQGGTHEPSEISASAAKKIWSDVAGKRNEHRGEKREWVTPDTVVECPKCGYEFRVGRPNND